MRYFFHILMIILPVTAFSQLQDDFFHGRAEMEKGHYDIAIGFLKSGKSSGNASAESLMNIGMCYYELGDYPTAIRYLLMAESNKKNKASYWLARSYSMLGKTDSATVYLKAHLNSSYKLPESTIKLDPAFQDIENTRLWKEVWSQEWYDEFENLMAEIHYLFSRNQYVESLNLIDENMEKYSNRHPLYAERGKIFLELKNFNSAVAAFSRAIEINGAQAEYYIDRARAYSELREHDLAVSDLTRALSLEPDHFSLYTERSRQNLKQSQFEMALDDIRFYLRFFPDDLQAIYLCGEIYYEQGNYLKALEWFNRCLVLDQTDADFFVARGNTYLQTKTYRYALLDYGMALDLDPDNPDTYFNKGMVRYWLNDEAGACNDWRKAARMGSTKAAEMMSSRCNKRNMQF